RCSPGPPGLGRPGPSRPVCPPFRQETRRVHTDVSARPSSRPRRPRARARMAVTAMRSFPADIPTCLVGSYAQPEWLIDRARLRDRFPPRVRARELWRVAPEFLEEACDDATLVAVRDQEQAGLD